MSSRISTGRAGVKVLRVAALFTFLTVAMGAVVCTTASGASCPGWPGCRPDHIAPYWQAGPLIEATHRMVAIVAGSLVLAAALLVRRRPGAGRGSRTLPLVALAGAAVAAAVGRLVVLASVPVWLGALDLCCALVAMCAMAVAAGATGRGRGGTRVGRQLSVASVVAVVPLHVSAVFLAGPGSYTRCLGWPLVQVPDTDRYPAAQLARLALAAVASFLVVATGVLAVRGRWARHAGIAVLALFGLEMALGTVLVLRGTGPALSTAYAVDAAALLWCLALAAGAARVPDPQAPPAGGTSVPASRSVDQATTLVASRRQDRIHGLS